MLMALYPELLPSIQPISAGLLALRLEGAERPVLVVKVMKEAILAARFNRGFKIYVAPVAIKDCRSFGIVTAFFDLPDDPLVLRSPLFDDEHSLRLKRLLLEKEVDVHLFDEHTRELLAYRCTIAVPEETRQDFEKASFTSFSYPAAAGALDQMQKWFGLRSAHDDASAFVIQFQETLMPEDIYLMNLIPEDNAFMGAQPFSASQLVREEPGPFQEHDIALLLLRVFRADQIYKSPLRVHDREEITDILVITDKNVLFIQAKDSPNTETVLRNSIARKKATALKSLKKAIGQARGAVRYAKSSEPMAMCVEGQELKVSVSRLHWRALVVVKELFNDEFASYSDPVLQLAQEIDVPCIALDYAELNMYTSNLREESSFLLAFDRVVANGTSTGMLPRLRIGPDGCF